MNLIDLLAQPADSTETAGRIQGAVVALVASVDDPQGQGRVKLEYPWLDDQAVSPWARLASPMAGPDRGFVFRPEPRDEVLVVFEHGDIRRPFVIGALWNGRDAMPSERGPDKANDIRLIKSRSGQVVVINDKSGEESITVRDKHGNVLLLDSQGVTITSDTIRLGSGNAGQGLVLGDALLDLFNQHTHPTGVGPSGPPVQPMVKGTHVSTKHRTE